MGYKKAYLKIIDNKNGMFSDERILYAKDYHGNEMSGFFDGCNIKHGRLEVSVIREESDSAIVVTPQFFMERSSIICVKKADLFYE